MIDPNKIIPVNDCKGTCRTPIGCTCGRRPMAEDSHLTMTAGEYKLDTTGLAPGVKACGCGKNPGGACGSSSTESGSSTGGGCSSGGGCGCSSGGGGCSSKKGGSCCSGTNKLEVYDWLADAPGTLDEAKMIEVQFKNTRKGYYLNSNNLELYRGDIVAVEATPGHDIGEVTLTGKLVQLQMMKNNYRGETKRVYRVAKPNDVEKYEEAKKREHKTMLRAREMAEELNLGMKISDVEYQGDGNKAIFYYIADERVDFRQLIKMYASEFRVKIEMKQIGARQEAGRVGGIGPCGRELCCSSSMSNFVSVSTSAARIQDIPLNPQKLAGQCGKLKCCLNFEVDMYVEAQRQLPSKEIPLETKDKTFYHFKTDVLSGMMTYSTDKHFAANLVTLYKDKVQDVIQLNKKGNRPLMLDTAENDTMATAAASSHDILDQDSINRFDQEGRKGAKNAPRNSGPKKVKKNGDAKVEGNGEGDKQAVKVLPRVDKRKPRPENRERNKLAANAEASAEGKPNEDKPSEGAKTEGANANNRRPSRNNRRNRPPRGENENTKPEA